MAYVFGGDHQLQPLRATSHPENSLDALLERTTIPFKRRLNGKETIRLLEYIASKTDFLVDYTRERMGRIDVPKGKAKARDIKIRGSFFDHVRYTGSAFFSCKEECDHLGKFTEMRFDTTPGYDIGEISPKLLDSIEIIRRVTNDYFNLPRQHEPL